MAMYNSSSNNNQHENDITIINSLFSSDYNYEPTHVDISDQNTNDNRDYFFIEHDLQDKMKQIEQILSYYRQDLKQESNTQLDCDRNLITRLVDFIRSEYSSNKNKIKDLDILFNEILNLNEKRFIEQKEKKNEQVQKEIANLKKLIVTSTNEDHITKNISQINSMIDYKIWMEIEEETRKLYNLVERQQNQINELIKLIPLQEIHSSRHSPSRSIVTTYEPQLSEQLPTVINPNDESKLMTRIAIGTNSQPYPESLVDALNNATQYEEPSVSRTLSHNNKKRCPLCNYEFLITNDELEMYTHVETCLISASLDDFGPLVEPQQYECPICNQRFSGNDDEAYREHLSNCYRESSGNF
ncbi:unnamed protein product [Rotaria sp. Silwood1]|nr:unnamed protein product [Rotaria sp. Silwood1]